MNSITEYLEAVEAREKKATPVPCPFCGNGALEIGMSGSQGREGYPVYVLCGECGCCGPWRYQKHALSLEPETIALWNNRADTVLLQLVRKYREALETCTSRTYRESIDDQSGIFEVEKITYRFDRVKVEDALKYDPREGKPKP